VTLTKLRFAIVGGHGQVGSMFAREFRTHGSVVIIDPAAHASDQPGMRVIASAAHAGDADVLAELADADVVLLALPESAVDQVVPAVARAMKSGAVLADTLSVKAQVVPLMARWASKHGLQACSLAPMFAPALGMAGRPMAAMRVADGDQVEKLLAIMRQAGARLVELSAAEYDRLAVVLQAATHAAILALGLTMARSGCEPGALLALAPPPSLTMLALAARIVSGNPEVYWDIQVSNGASAVIRDALRDDLDQIDRSVKESDPLSFDSVMDEVREYLGSHLDDLTRRCAALFERDELRITEGDGEPTTANTDDILASFRARIETVDAKVAELMAERFAICAEVAQVKRTRQIPMMQPARVDAVCDAYARRGVTIGVNPDFMRSLAKLIIAEACRLEDEIIDG
jgi:4-amino-4-deoxyprephenate dehydrogenase